MNTTSSDSVTFSKTARAAILAGDGEVGRAYKVAFIYGLETDPSVAAKFMKKLTLQARHPHITPNSVNLKPAKNLTSQKAVSDVVWGMPKQSASHIDGWT